MSLDEAIRYYSRLADECRRKANIERYDYMDLKDLAAEHGQLADWLNELKVLREKIRVLLEKQEADRWIPVTERPPEEDKDVLVTVHFLGLKKTHPTGWNDHIKPGFYVDIAKQYSGEWSSASDEYKVARSRHIVTAWRPLPAPYQEDEA